MTAVLRISDGTTTISLLNGEDGFYLNNWRPGIAQYKGGGVFQSSPLSDGRRLVTRQFDNAFETFDLKAASDADQDGLIYYTQELRRLLEKAVDYWATDWQNEPVWIEAQATCETNTRYALIHAYSTPTDDNPYAPPFLQVGGAALDKWTLVIERGHWRSELPTTSPCLEIAGGKYSPVPQDGLGYQWTVQVSLDDCFVEQGPNLFTDSQHLYMGRGAGGNSYDMGIRFRNVDIPQGATIQEAWILFECSIANAVNNCNVDIFGEDTDDAAIFSTYANFMGRARTVSTEDWDVIAAWVLGNNYYSPDIRTIIQEIVDRTGWASGNDLVIFLEDDGSNNGAFRVAGSETNGTYNPPALHVAWFDESGDYDGYYGMTATCEADEVFIANKDNRAQITHVYSYDAGGPTWSFNHINNPTFPGLPFDILPAVPAVGDACFFGVSTALPSQYGPFCSLVFHIGTAIADVTGIDWEYWDGAAWAALANLQDNTNADGVMTGVAFDTTGIKSVHWTPSNDWTAESLFTIYGGAAPDITAYWVRAIVTNVGGAQTGPTQIDEWIYTIIWACIDYAAENVLGDISALLRLLINYRSYSDDLTSTYLVCSMLYGLRSLSRGEDFRAYLTLGNVQENDGLTNSCPGGTTNFAGAPRAPAGNAALYNPAGVEALGEEVRITFTDAISRQYCGRYRVFLRTWQSGGAAGDFAVQVRATFGTTISTDIVTVDRTAEYALNDLGILTIGPPSLSLDADSWPLLSFDAPTISIYASNSNAAPGDLYFYDLILFPVDEFAGKVTYAGGAANTFEWDFYLDLDSVSYPKRAVSVLMRNDDDDAIAAVWAAAQNAARAFVHPNSDQRMWFLFYGPTELAPTAWGYQADSVTGFGTPQYLSMRGER